MFKDEYGNDVKMTDFEQVKEEILRRFGSGKVGIEILKINFVCAQKKFYF